MKWIKFVLKIQQWEGSNKCNAVHSILNSKSDIDTAIIRFLELSEMRENFLKCHRLFLSEIKRKNAIYI